jgi:hypothetical protein
MVFETFRARIPRPGIAALGALVMSGFGCGRIGYDPIDTKELPTVADAQPGADAPQSSGSGGGGEDGSAGGSGTSAGGSGGSGNTGASGSSGTGSGGGTGGTARSDGGTTSSAGSSGGTGGSAGSSGGTGGSTDSGGPGGARDAASDAPGDAQAIDSGPCVDTTNCTCTTFGNHAYRFCKTGGRITTWSFAETDCESAGMRLVRIDDQTENTFVRSTTDSVIGLVEVWIGAEDPTAQSIWQWPDGAVFWTGTGTGTPSLFANWVPSQPAGAKLRTCAGMVSGAVLAGKDGMWFDRSCSTNQGFVCEAY